MGVRSVASSANSSLFHLNQQLDYKARVPLAPCNRSQNSATLDILFPGPFAHDFPFQKADLSKHFLISDCSMTSFYAISALSFRSAFILACVQVCLLCKLKEPENLLSILLKKDCTQATFILPSPKSIDLLQIKI